MIYFMPVRLFYKYINHYTCSHQQMDPMFAVGYYQSCLFIAPKNQVILEVLYFITIKFFNVVPATHSHIDTACSKITY